MSTGIPRTTLGLLAGIGWGAILAHFFKSGDMAGPWLVIFFGPPVIFLVSPDRPIASWQTPVVATTCFGTILWRDPGETAGALFGMGLVTWLMCSAFSYPWVLVFQRRAQRMKEGTSRGIETPLSYIGVGLLLFLASALELVGFALTVYPPESGNPPDRAVPFYGFLMATAGTGLFVASYQITRKLGVTDPVQQVIDLMLGLATLAGTIFGFGDYFWPGQNSPPDWSRFFFNGGILCVLAGLEALAVMIWSNRKSKRLRQTSG